MMPSAFRSSGDLTADRRYAYAVGLLDEGDALAAGDLIAQALELVPDWPAGWFKLAESRERSGEIEQAAAAFRRAADLDVADALGARLHLARLGAVAPPPAPPAAYVRDLFDDYAGRFDQALVDGLNYRAPRLIAAALEAAGGVGPFAHVLDLGCGTGLMAVEIRAIAGTIIGVDLSRAMVEAARAKDLYDILHVEDILVSLAKIAGESCDLITAADVFCYLGDLTAALSGAARALKGGGYLAFSVERAPDQPDLDYDIGDSLRYNHTKAYIGRLAASNDLRMRLMACADLRNDRGLPVTGLIVVLQKT